MSNGLGVITQEGLLTLGEGFVVHTGTACGCVSSDGTWAVASYRWRQERISIPVRRL